MSFPESSNDERFGVLLGEILEFWAISAGGAAGRFLQQVIATEWYPFGNFDSLSQWLTG